MKDKWMNMGYEEEELLPFIEPVMDMSDQKRIDSLVQVIGARGAKGDPGLHNFWNNKKKGIFNKRTIKVCIICF